MIFIHFLARITRAEAWQIKKKHWYSRKLQDAHNYAVISRCSYACNMIKVKLIIFPINAKSTHLVKKQLIKLTYFLPSINQDAAPQVVLQALPQETPRVDGALGHCCCLLSSNRIYFLQHVAGESGAHPARLAPALRLDVHRLHQLQHRDRALGLRTSRLPETKLPRFPPPQIQPKLWQLWRPGQNFRN
jgi:hypothetical protein